MKCPSCGNEQAEGWLSCQKCHIIFSRWKPGSVVAADPSTPTGPAPLTARAEAAGPPRPEKMFNGTPSRLTVASGRPAGWLVYLLLILPCAVALWLLLNPKGLKVMPDSYLDKKNDFAIRVPDDWLTLTKENFDVIVRQYSSRLPANIANAMSSRDLAVSFIRLGEAGEFAPAMNVVIVKGALPPINEKSKLEAAKAMADGFRAMFADYKQESVKIIEVDKIRSLEIVSTSSLRVQLPNEEGRATLTLRYRQVFVPGKKQAYILTFTALSEAGEDSAADFQGMLDSFRVLKRPPRFGPVVNGGLIGALLGALFYLLSGLLRSLGSSEREN